MSIRDRLLRGSPLWKAMTSRMDALIALVNEQKAVINEMSTLVNELKTDHNAALTKLDADAGVNDTDYASLHSVTASDASVVSSADVKTLDEE